MDEEHVCWKFCSYAVVPGCCILARIARLPMIGLGSIRITSDGGSVCHLSNQHAMAIRRCMCAVDLVESSPLAADST